VPERRVAGNVKEIEVLPTLGPVELILILGIVIIVFGAGKLPEIGGAVGKSIREFRSSVSPDEDKAPATEDVSADKKA
jgi:sec-independent protein translocase protein TatA